ncbi:hypothetical protein [Paraphotobacterium marinum]|uniref:hypothetical protein n=1 Tax=Paraphotobacterium marinum TaxID=1755811 RepID=UPI0039EC5335
MKTKKDNLINLMSLLSLMLCISLFIVMFAFILLKGINFYWPHDIYQFSFETKNKITKNALGIIYQVNKDESLDRKQMIIKSNDRKLHTTFFDINSNHVSSKIKLESFAQIELNDGSLIFVKPLRLKYQNKVLDLSKFNKAKLEVKNLLKELSFRRLDLEKNKKNIEKLIRDFHLFGKSNVGNNQLFERQKRVYQDYNINQKKIANIEKELSKYQLVYDFNDNSLNKLNLSKIRELTYNNKLDFYDKMILFFKNLKDIFSFNHLSINENTNINNILYFCFVLILMSILLIPLSLIVSYYLFYTNKKTPLKNFISEFLIYLATIPSVLWGVFALGFFISWQYKFKGYNLIVPLITMTIISLPSLIILFRDKLLFIKRYYLLDTVILGANDLFSFKKVILPNVFDQIIAAVPLLVSKSLGVISPLVLYTILSFIYKKNQLDNNFSQFQSLPLVKESLNYRETEPLLFGVIFVFLIFIIILNVFLYSLKFLYKKQMDIY